MKPENVKCPECGGEMISRLNKKSNSRFWGCKNYPNCKGTRDVNGLSKAERQSLMDDASNGDEDPIRWDRNS